MAGASGVDSFGVQDLFDIGMAGFVKIKERVYSGKGLVNFSQSKKPILIGRFSNGMALYGSNATARQILDSEGIFPGGPSHVPRGNK